MNHPGYYHAKINKLLQQIDKMKNCQNCKHELNSDNVTTKKNPCFGCDGVIPSSWEMKNDLPD